MAQPLAERLRPKTLDDYIGQKHLVGEGAVLRKMIDAGLAVALASDFNPGTAPSGNMRFVVSLGSIKMKMTPAEALNAATLNSACAMGESRDYGSITRGKVANFYLTKPLPSLAYLPYAHQTPIIRKVVLKGREINI